MAGQQQQGGMPGMGMGSPEMGGMDLEALLGRGNTGEETEETYGQEPDVSDIDMDMLDAALQRPEEASGMEFQAKEPTIMQQRMA